MIKAIGLETWVYVLVQNPGENEHFVGQEDAATGLAFIPAFINKEAATEGIGRVAKEKGYKYEIQAIILEDLIDHGARGGFAVFVLDEAGVILKKYELDFDIKDSPR